LVGDDRIHLEAHHDRLLVRGAPALAGLIEVRGLGIRRLDYEPIAVVGLVVDLAADNAERLPAAGATVISGVELPRLAVAAGASPPSSAPRWSTWSAPRSRSRRSRSAPTTTSNSVARTSSKRSSAWTAAKAWPSSPTCSAAHPPTSRYR